MQTQNAYAKLNLTLDVLGRREDGYHDLCSVMQTVSLCDEVRVSLQTEKTVLCRWKDSGSTQSLPQNEENLCYRAAEAFLCRIRKETQGFQIVIDKQIPMQAGLAGGSADAAAVLRGLNLLHGEPLDPYALAELGAQVGSDVPFCVLGGTALCEGRGERVTLLPACPKLYVLLCKPSFGSPTGLLYQTLDSAGVAVRPNTEAMLAALRQKDVAQVGRLLCNVFEPVVSKDHPQLNEIKEALRACGACGSAMTGSGSVVFGIFRSRKEAQQAEAALRDKVQTYLAVTVCE